MCNTCRRVVTVDAEHLETASAVLNLDIWRPEPTKQDRDWPGRLSTCFDEEATARVQQIRRLLTEASIPTLEFELHHGDVYSMPAGTLHLFFTMGDAPVFSFAYNCHIAPEMSDPLRPTSHVMQSHWVVGLEATQLSWVRQRAWTPSALAGPSGVVPFEEVATTIIRLLPHFSAHFVLGLAQYFTAAVASRAAWEAWRQDAAERMAWPPDLWVGARRVIAVDDGTVMSGIVLSPPTRGKHQGRSTKLSCRSADEMHVEDELQYLTPWHVCYDAVLMTDGVLRKLSLDDCKKLSRSANWHATWHAALPDLPLGAHRLKLRDLDEVRRICFAHVAL